MSYTLMTLRPRASLACGLVLVCSACGSSAPTQQLVDARRTYDEATGSEAERLTPDKLLSAQQALEKAEAAHDDDPGSAEEAHLAYLAARKSAIAMAYGKIAAAKETEERAAARYQDNLRQHAQANQSQLASTQDALEAERTRRMAAEKRARSALQSLAQVAKVDNEQRGTVITLPGHVLFPSGGSALSPNARQSLNRVADALTQQPTEVQVVIEGYTDARGSEDLNQQLSKQRAEAVRNYLVERGLDAQRLSAVGRGEAAPIADNDTAEGRATNRRVAIVVRNVGDGEQQSGTTQGASNQNQ
jgi:outer membrane protein OmpA-like peptidoglycan-associated protein